MFRHNAAIGKKKLFEMKMARKVGGGCDGVISSLIDIGNIGIDLIWRGRV